MAIEKAAAILEAAKEGFGHQRSPIRMSLQRRRRKNEAITTQPDNLRNDGQGMQGLRLAAPCSMMKFVSTSLYIFFTLDLLLAWWCR